jgi:hypothetical protein
MEITEPEKPFWQIAEQFLVDPSVSKGTLMGFPCLRVGGDFFATIVDPDILSLSSVQSA